MSNINIIFPEKNRYHTGAFTPKKNAVIGVGATIAIALIVVGVLGILAAHGIPLGPIGTIPSRLALGMTIAGGIGFLFFGILFLVRIKDHRARKADMKKWLEAVKKNLTPWQAKIRKNEITLTPEQEEAIEKLNDDLRNLSYLRLNELYFNGFNLPAAPKPSEAAPKPSKEEGGSGQKETSNKLMDKWNALQTTETKDFQTTETKDFQTTETIERRLKQIEEEWNKEDAEKANAPKEQSKMLQGVIASFKKGQTS